MLYPDDKERWWGRIKFQVEKKKRREISLVQAVTRGISRWDARANITEEIPRSCCLVRPFGLRSVVPLAPAVRGLLSAPRMNRSPRKPLPLIRPCFPSRSGTNTQRRPARICSVKPESFPPRTQRLSYPAEMWQGAAAEGFGSTSSGLFLSAPLLLWLRSKPFIRRSSYV